MKLEAILPEIRKGRKFRNTSPLFIRKDDNFKGQEQVFNGTFSFLLNDYWELEPVKVEITREQLEKAWFNAYGTHNKAVLNVICKELGL